MRPLDIQTLVTVGRPTVDPAGTVAVFATSRPDVAANRNVGQLWRVDLPGGTPRRLTQGVADAAPRFSPDGAVVAFLRADAKGKPQIHVLPVAGGEPVQATDAPGGVSDYAWSPDGTRFAYLSRVVEEGRYGSIDGLDATAESPRRVTGVRWHANGLGYIADRPAHLFVIDVPDIAGEPLYEPAAAVGIRPDAGAVRAQARALTSGTASHSGVVFTPDGAEVLTVTEEIELDARDLASHVIAVSVDSGAVRDVLSTAARLSVSEVAIAADGTVALLASDVGPSGTDFVAPGVGLWLLGPDGPAPVTDAESVDLGEVGSHVTAIGDDFLVHRRARGRVHLERLGRDGSRQVVVDGDVEVNGHAVGGDRIVVAVSRPGSLGELELVGSGSLTDFGASARATDVVTPVEAEISGRDGYPVHGWVATPQGEGPHPVILMIHGGPYAQYGIHLFDEVQTLVTAGYAVVYCNPRGSAGYGRAHGRSIRHRMGTLDMHDVLDFLDAAVHADDSLDGARVGIMGGSYGGYLTAWTIAHDHRFAGAIVERGFLDPVSFAGTSDIGSFFGHEYVGEEPAQMAAQSPMAVVDQVTTPTFVVHAELDFRCPLEQATRYYSALRRQGTPAEMLIFPGENHELTRSGQPRHRVERFDAVLEWWARYLPVTLSAAD
ncbi:dipeptidyl aminopeptidase/acylaminoacyl peptidase [Microbacterium marinum]|uniref:Dipeptidyl aminopeptidase/acylaminoacyl peptidase n=1 Tax=Microbacterium marinum TaxID=421115 RepID=A0A7W7BR24_9MICO|nr:dipeptidyl aminopeptidase/acylaminoacyl peptidase [Microbacterium marinum]